MNHLRSTVPVVALAIATISFPDRGAAAIVSFTDEATFSAAYSGVLTVEDFEGGSVTADSFDGPFDAPLSRSVSTGPFPVNSIVDGLTITQSGGIDDSALFAANGASFAGDYPSTVVGTFLPTSSLELIFTSPVGALSFDAFTALIPVDQLTVTLFDAANNPLFTSPATTVLNGAATFFGFISDANDIARVRLDAPFEIDPVIGDVGYEVVDNIAFGPRPAAVPEPSSLALLGLTGLAGGGLTWRRRRRAGAA